jgi:hypothetical protein
VIRSIVGIEANQLARLGLTQPGMIGSATLLVKLRRPCSGFEVGDATLCRALNGEG